MRPLIEVAEELGLTKDTLVPYGRDKAKIDLGQVDRSQLARRRGRLILVSAITPTAAGEGKTTTSIGLADALRRTGRRACLALREPSLGPCFGVKGGGTGGGRSQLTPAEDINLHFTGDFHAISTAQNLIAAAIDNHCHHQTELDIDPRRVSWRRVLDMNDRALRSIVLGLGGRANGIPREGGFDITASSEVMAIFCLALDLDDLRARLDRTLVAFDRRGRPVLGGQLRVNGATQALLKDAFLPNLVQTLEGTPALVHGGPFANIAHGCSSVVATKCALDHADFVVTEAGFGFDLGAEKFFDIKCRQAGLDADAVVLVASVRSLKHHGGVKAATPGCGDSLDPNPEAVLHGLSNLDKHIESIRCFGKAPVVALNRFPLDHDEELSVVRDHLRALGVPFAAAEHYARGGEGAMDLAEKVVTASEASSPFVPLYALESPIPDKILRIVQSMYGARDVAYTKSAERELRDIEALGYGDLAVCVGKTQSSLSDDPKLVGRPRDFDITVRGFEVSLGAGFVVALTGDILRMPGLPRVPAAERIELREGRIVGL